MASVTVSLRPMIKPLQKRGSSVACVLPQHLLYRLGWNEGDHVALNVVDGSLVLTRVELPKVPPIARNTAGERR